MSKRVESLRKRVQRAHHSKADVIIGKNGITPSLLKEIDRRLERKEIVKIKILRSGVEGRRHRSKRDSEESGKTP